MSSRHMQRVSFLYALEPVLQFLYDQEDTLREARRRYLSHVRTHVLMAPLLVAMCIALEERVAKKEIPVTGMDGILHTTATTLSAIGDSFFSGSVLVLWALGCFLSFLQCAPHSFLHVFLAWTGILVVLLGFFRLYMFHMGVKYGLGALQKLRTLDLINWAERIKFCNALLLAYIFANMIDGESIFHWGNEVWAVFAVLTAVLLIQRAHVPRLILVAVLFIALFLDSIQHVVS